MKLPPKVKAAFDHVARLKDSIQNCSALSAAIEKIEFDLIRHGMDEERKLTRLIKRALIYKQTQYWNALDAQFDTKIKDLGKKAKKKK